MATHHQRGRAGAAAAAAAASLSSSSSSSSSTPLTKANSGGGASHQVLTTVHLHDITMAVSTNQQQRARSDASPSQPSSPPARSASSSSQVMAAVERLRQRIMSADNSPDLDDETTSSSPSSRAYIHPDAELSASYHHQDDDHNEYQRASTVYAAAAAAPPTTPPRSHAKPQPHPSRSERSQEPSLYEAIFGANVARRLQSNDVAPTPTPGPAPRHQSPPRTPKRPSTSSLSYSAAASPQRSGLSAKLHHLSSLPQLGSPERARRGGPPAGIDPHNSPSQEAMDREEEMAFSHPHQSFVLYSPGRRARPAAPHTPRKRQRVEPAGAAASPRYHEGAEETNEVAGMLAALADRNRTATPSRGAAAPATPSRLPTTPSSSSRHTFADPSSITPRRARVASSHQHHQQQQQQQPVSAPSEDALAANVLLGFASSPTPPRNASASGSAAATPPRPHAAAPQSSSLLNSLERRKSTFPSGAHTAAAPAAAAPRNSNLFEDCHRAVLQPAASITPPRDHAHVHGHAHPHATGTTSTSAPGAPRTPSPTPSTSTTPRTPHTHQSSGFAYSEFVNVSPSPQPRSRGPSGRFVQFGEGDTWGDGHEGAGVLTPGAFSAAFGAGGASPLVRGGGGGGRYRQESFDPTMASPTLSAARGRKRGAERQYD